MERNDTDRKIEFLGKVIAAHETIVNKPDAYCDTMSDKITAMDALEATAQVVVEEIIAELNIGGPKNVESDLDNHK